MAKLREIYKCEICGNIVEVLHGADGELVCCGKPMILMNEQSKEEGKTEKHKPIISGSVVSVGSVEHPMTEEHHIEWIEAEGKNSEYAKKFLKVNDKPVVDFGFEVVSARAYCNLHNLWKD